MPAGSPIANPFAAGWRAEAVALEYHVRAVREDHHGSTAWCKEASLVMDTDPEGRVDAFNPAELLLAAVAACMLKGIERVLPILRFELKGVEIEIHGVRQDKPPKMERIDYLIKVDTDESDHRIELLHTNVRKYGTIYNTVAAATVLEGRMVRAG
ncbi:MAG: OsmC family peroxiredoxin [Gammaproteobacteria bacterium]|nr:MAG: OsmC family peroxiredoxin [Gammaproteobacteria bacterium]